ncbi:hypothetical protein QVD17_17533 [Tagetes erecta]|uniref:Uncharacterized protein n=1 Tax=Tagetes erecta TaxID=13708 RepID=A0AAD8KU39_TARER|nr:hypothetical protein QVD17_17533 [Tagetes erecta]
MIPHYSQFHSISQIKSKKFNFGDHITPQSSRTHRHRNIFDFDISVKFDCSLHQHHRCHHIPFVRHFYLYKFVFSLFDPVLPPLLINRCLFMHTHPYPIIYQLDSSFISLYQRFLQGKL